MNTVQVEGTGILPPPDDTVSLPNYPAVVEDTTHQEIKEAILDDGVAATVLEEEVPNTRPRKKQLADKEEKESDDDNRFTLRNGKEVVYKLGPFLFFHLSLLGSVSTLL